MAKKKQQNLKPNPHPRRPHTPPQYPNPITACSSPLPNNRISSCSENVAKNGTILIKDQLDTFQSQLKEFACKHKAKKGIHCTKILIPTSKFGKSLLLKSLQISKPGSLVVHEEQCRDMIFKITCKYSDELKKKRHQHLQPHVRMPDCQCQHLFYSFIQLKNKIETIFSMGVLLYQMHEAHYQARIFGVRTL